MARSSVVGKKRSRSSQADGAPVGAKARAAAPASPETDPGGGGAPAKPRPKKRGHVRAAAAENGTDGSAPTASAEPQVRARAQNNARLEASEAPRGDRVLILSTRGVTARFRHLMEDLRGILPHAKKDSKLDHKERLSATNEVAELRQCNWSVLFESRKRQDLYLWLARCPSGPSAKLHVSNVHTMGELHFSGNSLLYSRPVLVFDAAFERSAPLRLLRAMLTRVFAPPPRHRRTKPFVDHVISFMLLDHRVWFRHFQIADATPGVEPSPRRPLSSSSLVEIGPRFVMSPIRILHGSFTGVTLYDSPHFVHPNLVRRALRQQTRAGEYDRRQQRGEQREQRRAERVVPRSEVNDIFRAEPAALHDASAASSG